MGIDVELSSPKFSYSHQKSYLIDAGTEQARVLITDFNIGPAYFAFVTDPADKDPHELGTRGFAVLNTDPKDVAEVAAVFEADWPPYQVWPPYVAPNLVWGPGSPSVVPTGNSITGLTNLIASAQTRIDLYVQALAYPAILFQPLLERIQAGVKVRIIGNLGGIDSQALAQLSHAGAQIVRNPHLADRSGDFLYVHSKSIVTDYGTPRQVGFLGSENPFLDESIETERELGAFVTDGNSLTRFMQVFDADFQRATPYLPAANATHAS